MCLWEGGGGGGGVSWTVKRWWWRRWEEVSSALWQQLRAYMENRFGSSQISVTEGAILSLSHPVTASLLLFSPPLF